MKHSITFTTRWADLDVNNHMRHSAYNDYAAHARFQFFVGHGFDGPWFVKNNISPILFREETLFFKEISAGDEIVVDAKMLSFTTDGVKWSFAHRFMKGETEMARLVVDGAWMNFQERKLGRPPAELFEHIQNLERSDDFKLVERNK